MKNIELTEDHKSKLLEMCKVLFPEIKSIVLQENLGTLIIDQLQQIHWFEFCMTHLCDKISMNLTNQMCTGMPQYYDESEKLDWNSQSLVSMLKECHPIDYLYEEFKKLK